MAEPNQETPPPTVNTPRPNLHDRASQRRQKPSGGFAGYLAFLGKAVSLVVIVFGAFYLYQNVLTKPGAAQDPVKPVPLVPVVVTLPPPAPRSEPEDLEQRQQRIEFETVQGIQRQKLALAKLKQQQVIGFGGTVTKALDEWRSELDRWESEVVTLLDGDKGKPLAGNKPLIKRFRAVYDHERSGKEDEERLRSQTEAVIAAVKLANDTPSDASSPPEDVTTELQGLLRQARQGRDSYRTAREQVASLVKQAKSGTSGAPGTKPLAEALSEQQDAERLASAAVVEAEAAKAREEATRRKAAAEVERLKSEEAAAARIAKVKAEQARELGLKEEARLQEETRMLKVKADQARIRRLAADPAIQAQFSAFLANGRYQFEFGKFGSVPEPASYQTLVNRGHLSDITYFTHAMAGRSELGAGRGTGIFRTENDRPHGSYPTTQAQQRRMEQLFEQFKELAPTWIQMGKLLP